MHDVDHYFDAIDENRIRRARELSEIKHRFAARTEQSAFGIDAKAIVMLAYAHWEGFYNDCVRSYLAFLKAKGGRVRDSGWLMLMGAFASELQALQDRNHSHVARRQFVERMRNVLDCGFEHFRADVIEARSNLDYEKLAGNCLIMDFDVAAFQQHRIWIDKQLVQWRHEVAHGDLPDLSGLDLAEHVDRASLVMLLLADRFQEAMLQRLER